MSFSGQHGQEGLNFSTTHASRMPKSAPLNEDPGPLHTGLPGAQAIVLALNTLMHLIQYARGAQHGKGGGFHGRIQYCLCVRCMGCRPELQAGFRHLAALL